MQLVLTKWLKTIRSFVCRALQEAGNGASLRSVPFGARRIAASADFAARMKQ